jgi:EAL domain-containing protein (putative c-di-GMP-specific phosphodiesterase class I)
MRLLKQIARLPSGASAHALRLAAGLALFSSVATWAVLAIVPGWIAAPGWLAALASVGAASLVLAPAAIMAARLALGPLEKLAQDAARQSGFVASGSDVFRALAGSLKLLQARLDHSQRRADALAFVDPVTQLPNQERLRNAIEEGLARSPSEQTAALVAVFSLRRISKHAQTLDPHAAHDLAKIAAERVVQAARRAEGASNTALVASLGAEQFGVYLPLTNVAQATRFVQTVNSALNEPLHWRGASLFAGACAGAALGPRDGRDADTLIRRARIAESSADRAPANIRIFSTELDRKASSHLSLEREMRAALERNEFRAYFQPKMNLVSARVEACEALARWVRPDQTIVGPGRFVPIAEESGLIGELSDAILREACWKAAAWARAGHAIKVAVNVSALQLHSDRFATGVLDTLSSAGLAPSLLELEITESIAMSDPEVTGRIIQPLREAGVRLAIDDFGCGHSNLAALSILPFDVIKIDQQFVRALEKGGERAVAIVDMILALARSLRLEVVAEGVERRAEADFMAARGCHWAQGFLYGAAVSAPEFAELLARQTPRTVSEDHAA